MQETSNTTGNLTDNNKQQSDRKSKLPYFHENIQNMSNEQLILK